MSGLTNYKELAELRRHSPTLATLTVMLLINRKVHLFLIKLDFDFSREECMLDLRCRRYRGDGYIGFKERSSVVVTNCGAERADSRPLRRSRSLAESPLRLQVPRSSSGIASNLHHQISIRCRCCNPMYEIWPLSR